MTGPLPPHRVTAIVDQEIHRTQAALVTARRDSRLGLEWEENYFYWPEIIEKKLQMLHVALNDAIPTYCHEQP